MSVIETGLKTKFRKLLLIILTVLTVFLFLPDQTYATSGSTYTIATDMGDLANWINPLVINNSRALARDLQGNLYAVMNGPGAGGKQNIFLYKSVDNGHTWTGQAVTTLTDNNFRVNSAIAIDGNDYIHVVWQDCDQNYICQNYYREFTTSWQPIVQLTTDPNYGQFAPAIAIDSHNYVHVAWPGKSAASNHWEVRYTKYTTSWSPVTNLTSNADDYFYYLSIAIDSQDNIHLVFCGNNPDYQNQTQIFYLKYSGSWQPIVALTTDDNYFQESPSIAIDSNDYLHVVWCGNDQASPVIIQIRYRKFTTSWQPIVDVTNDATYTQYAPAIAVDSNDYLHVVWQAKTATTPNVWQSKYAKFTTSWQPAEDLTSGSNDQSGQNIIWAMWPKQCNAKWDETKDGFAFISFDYDTGDVFFYASSDLDWQEQSCPEPTPTPTPASNPTSTLNILPQTGADLY